jgi:hypothetical protein
MRTGSKAIARSNILRNMAIAPKLKSQLAHMQLCTSHDGAERGMLQGSLTWKTMHELHGEKDHAYQHQSWDTFKRKRMQIKQVFSLRKQMFCSARPTSLEVAAKFKIGVVERDAT